MEELRKGTGPIPADYMVVGEVWTALGVKTNKVFTGAGESLMEAVLRAVQLTGQVHFTNAIPFATKTVTKGAVDLNRQHLIDEVKEVQPKVILACGNWATYALLGKSTPITEIRGNAFWSVELQAYVIPTLHPNAVTYNPGMFQDFANDIEKFKAAITFEKGGLTLPEPNLIKITNVEEMRAAMEVLSNPQDGCCSVDIETEGFDFFRDAILTIGLGPTDDDVYIMSRSACEDPECQRMLTELFAREDIEWIYQNGKFDVKFMRANPDPELFGIKKACVIPTARCDYDTMLAHYCCDERQGTHGLKLWAREEFDAPDWEADIKKWLPTKDTPYSAIPEDVLMKYQAYDVFYTRKGYYRFNEKMAEDDTLRCFDQVYRPAVKAFTEIELAGIPVNRARLQELYEEAQPRIKEAAVKLEEAAKNVGWDPVAYAQMKNKQKMEEWLKVNKWLPPEKQAKKPGGTEIPKFFNPNSHPQLSWVAYDLCNMPLFEGKKTCSKEAVDMYRLRHPFWEALAEYKEVSDLFGTFIKGMLERIDPDDRIRPDFLLHGTKTGRISCTNPNMQNLPRGSVIKDFFVADEGCVVVNADYKTLEVAIAAILSGDPAMKRSFIEKLDFHSETTRNVFKDDVALLEECVATKNKDRFIQYLQSPLMLEIRQKVTEQVEAGEFDEAFHATWKHMRFLTKFITFGIMYGRGPKSLAEGELRCSIADAQKYTNQFFAGYPMYSKFLKDMENQAINKGFVQNVFGFKRRWPFVTNDIMHEIRNQSWNTPIQGAASMVCMQALCRLQAELTKRGWGRVLFTVHDSIVYSIRKDVLQEAMTFIHQEMIRDVIGTDCPLEAELEVGPSYKKVEPCILKDGRWVPEEPNEWLEEVLQCS